MNEFNISTTGQDLFIDDLQVNLIHPQTINLCDLGFSFSDILSSRDLQDAMSSGLVTAEDGVGNPITDVCLPRITSKVYLLPFTWMQVNNTDIVTNLNTSTSQSYTATIPVSGTTETGSNVTDFTKTSDGIQCNFNGVILCFANIDMTSTGVDVNIYTRLRLNGSVFGPACGSGLILGSGGQSESSTQCVSITQVSVGDEITVGARRESLALTDVTLSAAGTSNLIIIRLS